VTNNDNSHQTFIDRRFDFFDDRIEVAGTG